VKQEHNCEKGVNNCEKGVNTFFVNLVFRKMG